MSTVRSRRWVVEIGGLEDQFFQHAKVECAWLHFWQRAGSDRVEVEQIDLWMQPWGEEIAQIKSLDYLDELSTPDWVRDLVTDHWPVGPEVSD